MLLPIAYLQEAKTKCLMSYEGVGFFERTEVQAYFRIETKLGMSLTNKSSDYHLHVLIPGWLK